MHFFDLSCDINQCIKIMIMNVEASTSNIKTCDICGSKSDGLHYGKQCCRACAAFFRRTTRLKLKYKCKKKNTCSISKNTRVMCRFCRYKKCLENGMLISSVNEPFDSIGKRKITQNNVHKSNQNISNFMEEMINGYHNFLYLRKASTAFVSFGNNNGSSRECITSTYETSQKQCCIESSLIKDILISFFHPYSVLNETEQTAMFEKFYSRFSNLERAFNTYKKFGSIDHNQNLIMPDGNYININELQKYYQNCTKTNPEEVANIFYPSIAYIVNDIVPFMSKITVAENEICALFGILLWQERTMQFPNTTVNLIHLTRENIFKELSQYYQNQNKSVEEVGVKIGNLMLLNTKIEHSINMVKENREVAELFDMIEFDNCCRE